MTSEPPSEISGSVAGDVVGGDKTVTQTAGGDIVGGDKITHAGSGHIFAGSGPVVVVQPAASASTARDRANQLLLLQKVKAFWIAGVLERSVHSAFLIELGRELRTDAIDHPWASVLEVPDAESRPLPKNVSDLAVFEEAGRALLILGAPGAGKTTTLLEIARELIAQAETDPSQPIPVVFNLSNWAIQRADLSVWLVSELAIRYQVPRAVGRDWLTDHRILPLLDGLDEVAPAAQAACVRAINDYVDRGGLPGLIVCCRSGEYAALPIRLRLNAAIAISPLSPEQIDDYLEAGGESLAALRQVMQSDDVLEVLAQTPLFLSLMCLAYQDVPTADLACPDLTTVEQRRRHLLDQFVARMLKRKGRRPGEVPGPELLRWLGWLARRMNANSITVFASERMQPRWIDNAWGRWAYALLSRVGLWLALGLGIGLAITAPFPTMVPVGTTSEEFVSAAFSAASLQTALGSLASYLTEAGLIGLFGGVVLCLRLAWRARQPPAAQGAAPGLAEGVRNVLAVCVLPIALVAAISAVISPTLGGFTTAEILALNMILWIPTMVLAAAAFRARESGPNLARDIPAIEALDWSWPSSLKGLVGGFLVGTFMALMCVFSIISNYLLADRVFVSIVLALPVGLLGGVIGGTMLGLRGRSSVQTLPPGSWVARHARNALAAGTLIGLVTFLCVATVALIANYMIDNWVLGGRPLWQTLVVAVGIGWLAAIPVGFAAALSFGGGSLIQRAALRLVLVLQHRLPWRLAPLAEQAENLVFLRRVGGGYIFIHGLVQDYFASLPGR